ncbi:hypothetical protein ACQ4LE_001370 [Meloidogyne hapla]|uniref:Uncharacterized protein n=1 Tax=Meloidogyne hapla TaxID=6305 RepID=A0A1I8BVH1_MELHA
MLLFEEHKCVRSRGGGRGGDAGGDVRVGEGRRGCGRGGDGSGNGGAEGSGSIEGSELHNTIYLKNAKDETKKSLKILETNIATLGIYLQSLNKTKKDLTKSKELDKQIVVKLCHMWDVIKRKNSQQLMNNYTQEHQENLAKSNKEYSQIVKYANYIYALENEVENMFNQMIEKKARVNVYLQTLENPRLIQYPVFFQQLSQENSVIHFMNNRMLRMLHEADQRCIFYSHLNQPPTYQHQAIHPQNIEIGHQQTNEDKIYNFFGNETENGENNQQHSQTEAGHSDHHNLGVDLSLQLHSGSSQSSQYGAVDPSFNYGGSSSNQNNYGYPQPHYGYYPPKN